MHQQSLQHLLDSIMDLSRQIEGVVLVAKTGLPLEWRSVSLEFANHLAPIAMSIFNGADEKNFLNEPIVGSIVVETTFGQLLVCDLDHSSLIVILMAGEPREYHLSELIIGKIDHEYTKTLKNRENHNLVVG